eukprot:5827121-Alexandrium_andersonii.AAC.1
MPRHMSMCACALWRVSGTLLQRPAVGRAPDDVQRKAADRPMASESANLQAHKHAEDRPVCSSQAQDKKMHAAK